MRTLAEGLLRRSGTTPAAQRLDSNDIPKEHTHHPSVLRFLSMDTHSHHSKAALAGTPEELNLHIYLLNRRWIVENYVGESIAEAPTREEAIELARKMSSDQEACGISVHAEDGQVQETIDV